MNFSPIFFTCTAQRKEDGGEFRPPSRNRPLPDAHKLLTVFHIELVTVRRPLRGICAICRVDHHCSASGPICMLECFLGVGIPHISELTGI